MKTLPSLLLSAVVAAVVAFIVTRTEQQPSRAGNGAEARYEQILRTKTIRCGYVLDPPGTVRDPNTGRMSGVIPEALEAAAKADGYKIEWTEEVGYSNMIEGLQAGHYDAICASIYYNASRSQFSEPIVPYYYTLVFAYARPADHRFDAGL